MNIALCLSGATRYIDSGLYTIKKIKQSNPNNKFYIFIHTWDIKDIEDFGMQDIEHVKINKQKNTEKNKNKIIGLFKPDSILIEDSEIIKNEFISILCNFRFNLYHRSDTNLLSMYYSIYKSNELKNKYEKINNINFDWCFRMRFDSKINNDIKLEYLDNNYIYIPNENDYHGINDQFAFGKSDLLDKYCSVYKNIGKIQRSCYNPEIIMMENLIYNKLLIKRIDINVDINGGMKW